MNLVYYILSKKANKMKKAITRINGQEVTITRGGVLIKDLFNGLGERIPYSPNEAYGPMSLDILATSLEKDGREEESRQVRKLREEIELGFY